jgi:hypothetical protein
MTGLPGNGRGVGRAVDKVAWAGQMEQEDSWDMTARTGQTSQDRISWTGHLEPDNWDKRAEKGQTGQVGCMSISKLYAHDHAVCLCPCCMSTSLLHVHVGVAWTLRCSFEMDM